MITGYRFVTTTPMRYLLAVGHDGRCLLRINWMYYDASDLRALGAAMGVDYQTSDDISPKQLRAEIPGAVPFMVLHPVLLGMILTVLILVAIIAGLAISGSGGSS